MDQTTQQVLAVLFVFATVVLVYTARYFQRRGRQRALRRIAGVERVGEWTKQSIEANRPLHLALGGAAVGEDNTAVALAGAEFFHHLVERANASDVSPIVTMSAASSIPLGQDTVRRAWRSGDYLARAQWYPPDIAYAAAVTGALQGEDPAAHILAGSFGPELALMIDTAGRRGQGSLAVSDRLEGQAVAYAMADEYLIGEEIFAAAGYATDDGRAQADAIVLDVWRALLIMGVTIVLMLEVAKRMPWLNWALVLSVSALLVVFGLLIYRRHLPEGDG